MVLMKNKINFEDFFEIYLFTDHKNEGPYSKLGEFISFLKYNKAMFPYKFSYVGQGDDLIPDLTLNENILMNFSPNSLTTDKENQFQDYLREQPNRYLEELYRKIISPGELTAHSDAQMKKLASLFKSLIYEGQFIFLEEPEKLLEREHLDLFTSALKEQIAREKINVFIFSNNQALWNKYVDKLVTRKKDYSFKVEKAVTNKFIFEDQKIIPFTRPINRIPLIHKKIAA
jgi:ABC-type lipoprotein export system ATPase subunit